MTKPKPYNGHHCWNCWNVALWIGNDEGLYRLALECKRLARVHKAGSRNYAALCFEEKLGATTHTPDGAKYTHASVRHALAGLDS